MSSVPALMSTLTTAPLSPAHMFRVSGSMRGSLAFCAAELNQANNPLNDSLIFFGKSHKIKEILILFVLVRITLLATLLLLECKCAKFQILPLSYIR